MPMQSHPRGALSAYDPLRYLPVPPVPVVPYQYPEKKDAMLLSDVGLEQVLRAEPGNPYRLGVSDFGNNDPIQPASIDVRLGSSVKRAVRSGKPIIPGEEPLMADMSFPVDGVFCFRPNEFYLATTMERFEFGSGLAGKIEGKSSLGRIGIEVHSTAGWIDPGFEGEITFELTVKWPDPVLLSPGMKIGQVCVFALQEPARRPYGHETRKSKYQNQRGATPTRWTR